MINWQTLSEQEQKEALARPAIADNEGLTVQVDDIISQVKNLGDKSLFELTQRFDGATLSKLAVKPDEVAAAKASLSAKRLAAIETAFQQIKLFHQA